MNVREGPKITAKKIGIIKQGTKITAISKTTTGWVQIHFKSKTGYVSSKYLTVISQKASYLPDKTKIYTYSGAKGTYQLFPTGDQFQKWDIWYYSTSKSKTKQVYLVSEDHKGLYTGFINSESYTDIQYPLKAGQKWSIGNEGAGKAWVASTSVTVKTPAGTYNDCIQVMDDNGYTFYFAQNTGLVKCLYNGKLFAELKNLKKK